MIDDPLRPLLTVYGRPGCHLCEEAERCCRSSLEERVRRGEPMPRVRHVSIDGEADLETRYGALIPVFVVGGRTPAGACLHQQAPARCVP